MNDHTNTIRRNRIEGLITSWSLFTFWMFFFVAIGIYIAKWFNFDSFWIWFVGGILLIGAIAETIRYSAFKAGRRKRVEALITSWSLLLFFVLLFYVCGILIKGWWSYGDWWIWFIIGMMALGTISSTVRYFMYSYEDKQQYTPPTDSSPLKVEPITSPEPVISAPAPLKDEVRFCESCGVKVEGTERFCANCGAPLA